VTRTRLRKVTRDLTQRWGRTAIVLFGLMISLFGAGAVAVAIAILSHDLDANFRRTDPANITFDIRGLTPQLLNRLAAIPGVIAADDRPTIQARIEVAPGRWLQLIISVGKDFDHMAVAHLYSETGAWPPPDGAVLLERDGKPFFRPAPEGLLKVRLPDGTAPEMAFAGYAFDPAQHPSRMEMMIYGYVNVATAAAWPYKPDVIRVLFTTAPEDQARVTDDIARVIATAGAEVRRFEAYPRAKYGHQFQLDAIRAALAAAAGMLVLIGVVLVSNLVGSLMTKEQRAIGVMRALGGRTGQIMGDYLLAMGGLGLIAGIVVVTPALKAGMAITRAVAQGLNFNVLSVTPPLWVGPGLIAAGLIVPVATAFLRVRRAVNMPVVQALSRGGAQDGESHLAARLTVLPPLMRMAITAILRDPRQVVLPAVVLSLGLSFFITVLNVRSSMLVTVDAVAAERPYDLLVAFKDPYPLQDLETWAKEITQLDHAEFWLGAPGAFSAEGRTLSNSVAVRGVPKDSKMVNPALLAGRWIGADRPDGVVVTQKVMADSPVLQVGKRYDLRLGNRQASVEIIGVIKEFSPGVVYAQAPLVDELTGHAGHATQMIATTKNHSLAGQRAGAGAVDGQPLPAGYNIVNVQMAGGLAASVTAHLVLVSGLLLFVAVLALLVGLLALASSTGVSVAQRFREIAVLKALGGRAPSIAALVIGEALAVALLGWGLAMAFAPAVSRFVTSIFGGAIIGYPFDYHAHPFGAPLTLAAAAVIALLASAGPVRKAIGTRVHRALRTE
jgi:putative ABC transport system permease protein